MSLILQNMMNMICDEPEFFALVCHLLYVQHGTPQCQSQYLILFEKGISYQVFPVFTLVAEIPSKIRTQ